ncbi:MAG: family 1 glycosylhydrolase [Chitinivibrionales bacterium]|nr:family 1 glycosylhydrolase [Chitinivibrionales bacterium]
MLLSWHRILPEGIGDVNSRGLDFYDALVPITKLKRKGVTIYGLFNKESENRSDTRSCITV